MLSPSHNMTLWQAAKWADRKQILRYDNGDTMYAIYSSAYRGGKHADISGKVFCLGTIEKCRELLKLNPDDARELSLQMVDLEELAIQMDLEENEIPERDSRCD